MKISDKRKAGEILDRGGIASRVIALAENISQGTYKNAIEKAGQISALIECATYDEYWNEKRSSGVLLENCILTDLKNGDLDRHKVAHNVDPYDA